MENKKIKKIIVFLVLFLMGTTLVSMVSAGVSDAGVEYDSEIDYLFLVMDKVPVMVDVRDFSNITIDYKEDSIEIQRMKDNQRNDILRTITDNVLSTLPDEEFQLESKSEFGGIFAGDITKKGFEKLLQDTRVKKIHDNTVKGHESSGEIKTSIYFTFVFLPIIFFILLMLLLIRRRKKIKKINSIIILLVLIMLTISLVAADNGISQKNVKFDKGILEIFNNKTSEEKIWVPVMVDVKDTSGIIISKEDSIEIQKEKDRERYEILGNIAESVLGTLSKEEFELGGQEGIYWFYGNITKEGFEKLLEDTRIKKIYADKEIHISAAKTIKNLFINIIPILLIFILIILLVRYGKKIKWKIKN